MKEATKKVSIKRQTWNSRERSRLSHAIHLAGTKIALGRRAIEIGNELGVRVPKSDQSVAITIENIISQKRTTEKWLKDLLLVTIDTVIEEKTTKKKAGGQPPPPLPPPLPAELLDGDARPPHERVISELREQMEQAKADRDKYREQALTHQANERKLQAEVDRLTKEQGEAALAVYEVEQIRDAARVLLKELVLADSNGSLDKIRLRAAQLVLRQEKVEEQ